MTKTYFNQDQVQGLPELKNKVDDLEKRIKELEDTLKELLKNNNNKK